MASYVNLARCYMLQGMLDKTHAYIENWMRNVRLIMRILTFYMWTA